MWWGKAAITEYILRSWSVVKMGTTAAQKKLFFSLRKQKNRLRIMDFGDLDSDQAAELAAVMQVSEKEVVNMNRRLAALDVSLNAPLTQSEDESLEFQALLAEIDRVAASTEFNSIALLDGSAATVDIQVGIDAGDTISVALVDTTAATLLLDTHDLTDTANAQLAITAVDLAIDSVNSARGSLGASQNRLQSVAASIMNVRENLSAAESRIRDVDVAFETADLTRNTILQQAAVSVLSQANVQPQLALSLLG